MTTRKIRQIASVVLLLISGLVTAWLYQRVEPLIPAGEWHRTLSKLFIVVTWPLLMVSLQVFFVRYRMPERLRALLGREDAIRDEDADAGRR